MQINTIAALRAHLAQAGTVAFVPTMGNLHEGHIDLVRQARGHADCTKGRQSANRQADCGAVTVVVSIFVNPLQFGPAEDFDKYPRTLDADCAKLEGLADVVFVPAVNEMYARQQTVFVEPPPIADELCGAARPGHFRGMATVVLKLLNTVQPQVALFGKKDYQQLHIIRQMVAQMNLPVRIIGGETVRAADGLALSSRNQYLSAREREEAVFLQQTLDKVRLEILGGARDYAKVEADAASVLTKRGWQVEYVSVRDQESLGIPAVSDRMLVVLAAARLGATRLIDNLEVELV
ncbi:MAG: pantoate--beta-alanine ligase [Gallionellaceae bacterium]|nr:MAG: pantoate--beta-alanine ligase [Gallionellaceae bacterium]